MTPEDLAGSAAGLALDLIDKNGTFLPICKAVDDAGTTFVYTPASELGQTADTRRGFESVRASVERDRDGRRLAAAAFAFHSRVRVAGAAEKVPAVEVELHARGRPVVVYYFLYRSAGGRAEVVESHTAPGGGSLFG